MKNIDHPLRQFIICFDEEFWSSYSIFLYHNKENQDIPEEYNSIVTVLEIAIKHIYSIIHVLMVSIIKFYNLELKGQELWKDLILNAITSMVVKNNVYFILYNLQVKALAGEITKISKTMDRLKDISTQDLGIPDVLG